MKTTWMLSLLAAIVLFLAGGLIWTTMSSNPAVPEAILVYSVDLLGVLWVVVVIALAVVSWSRPLDPKHDFPTSGYGSE
jgi:Zn-dependent protease with chaperone function